MKLSSVNNILIALIILINAYIVIAPFFPSVLFHFQSHTEKQQLETKLHGKTTTGSKPTSVNQVNQVIIPSMLLDQPILEGSVASQYRTLDRGIWRWPKGGTPGQGGNTTLIGHRFTYTNPRGVFYFLNKVKIGDEIGVIWNNHKYLYRVFNISEVSPHDTQIEDNSPKPELTLFTCTPLWLPKDRLVVVAAQESSL